MKFQFFSLLKYELTRFFWLIPVVYLIVSSMVSGGIHKTEMNRSVYMFGLQPSGSQPYVVLLLYFAFWVVFFFSAYSRDAAMTKNGTNLDFFFSRAIDRRAWFCAKTLLFLAIVVISFAWLHRSASGPSAVKIELPYHPVVARHELTSFFQAHFPGAYLEKPDSGSNEDYLVVPHAGEFMTRFEMAFDFLVLILFQVAAFLLWPRFKSMWVVLFPLLILPSLFLLPSGRPPSRYEQGLALVAEHPVPVFAGLVFLYLAAQFFCGWRFVRTEMLQ